MQAFGESRSVEVCCTPMRGAQPALSLMRTIVLIVFSTTTILRQVTFEPTLDFTVTEFELGEAIVFHMGRHTSTRVDPARLMEASCSLSIKPPNGAEAIVKTIQGLGVYDGPSLVQSLGHKVLLNDLVALSPGGFRVAHTCGTEAAVRVVTIKPARLVEQLSLEPAFPGKIDLSGNDPLAVQFSAKNQGAVTLHVLKSALDRPLAVFAIPSLPGTFRMYLKQPTESAGIAHLQRDGAYTATVSFENPLKAVSSSRGGSLVRVDRFQLNFVFVIPITSDENPAGVEGLYRFTACYDAAGQRVTTTCTPFGMTSYFP